MPFWISLVTILVTTILILVVSLRGGRGSLFGISLFIFYTLFFVVAPAVQMVSNRYVMVNYLTYDDLNAVIVSSIIALFAIAYSFSYYHFSKDLTFNARNMLQQTTRRAVNKWGLMTFIVVFAISSFVFLRLDDRSSIVELFYFKFFAMVTLAAFCFTVIEIRSSSGLGSTAVLVLMALMLFALVLISKNPFYERRNAIGPTYLLIMFTLMPFMLSRVRFILFSVVMMLVLFPLSSLLTHDYGVIAQQALPSLDDVTETLLEHYNETHYDAWANGLGMLEMIQRQGYGYGYQLLGAILFFVPRSVWAEKPLTTGEMFGDFAMNNGPLWFNNVSFALPFEAYHDFWWPGVLLYGGALGWIVAALERKAGHSLQWGLFYIYFAFSCYFVLRGPFLSSYAYILGAFVAIVIAMPRLTKNVG